MKFPDFYLIKSKDKFIIKTKKKNSTITSPNSRHRCRANSVILFIFFKIFSSHHFPSIWSYSRKISPTIFFFLDIVDIEYNSSIRSFSCRTFLRRRMWQIKFNCSFGEHAYQHCTQLCRSFIYHKWHSFNIALTLYQIHSSAASMTN